MTESFCGKELPDTWPKTVYKAQPLGFCAGVVRSVEAYQRVVDKNPGRRIFSVGQPAHNDNVNQGFEDQGVVFVDSIKDVDQTGIALLGPHGSEIEELQYAIEHNIEFIDTVCPLVKKVDEEIDELLDLGYTIVYFGKKGHQETKGILSHDTRGGRIILIQSAEELDKIEVDDPEKIAFNSQTTLAADKVIEMQKRAKEKWPNIKIPRISDVCYATQNRQDALRMIIEKGTQIVVILGSETSSNGKELKNIAMEKRAQVLYVNDATELNRNSFRGFQTVGLNAAASVSDEDVMGVEKFFLDNFGAEIITVSVADESRIRFAKPEIQNPKSS